LEANDRQIVLELKLADFESETITANGVQYQRLRVSGWSVGSGESGRPELPGYSLPLGMPHLGTPHIEILETDSQTHSGVVVYPKPALIRGGTDELPELVETFALDAATYNQDAFYPGQLAAAAEVGLLRDQPIFQLRVYPFQFNPAQQALRVYQRLKVRVTFPAGRPGAAQSGPASPAFEKILQGSLLNYDSLPRPQASATPPGNPPIGSFSSQAKIKLKVEQAGLYRVTYSNLQGIAPADFMAGDPRNFQLSNQGTSLPILFVGQDDGSFNPGDSFIFYAQAINTDYTKQNIYWLSLESGPGLRMSQRSVPPDSSATPANFSDTRRYEQDKIYWQGLPNGNGKDHWFWDKLTVTNATPVSKSYTFTINNIAGAGSAGQIKVVLQGSTTGNHLTQVYLNNTPLLSAAEQAWSGNGEKLYQIAVAQNLFISGNNQLKVENILPGGVTASEFYVNWFEATYQDTYLAESNQLTFSAPATATYTFVITNFSNNTLELFDISNPAAPTQLINHAIEADGGSYRLRFSDSANPNQKYLAQSTAQLPTPAIELDEASNWKSPAHGATYIIITHPSLYNAAQGLATYRAGQGESVVTVKTTDIYDEFNNGIYDPQAIRSFLEYAYANWSPQPVYVALIGDASLDPKNNLGSSLPDLTPVYYQDTPLLGQTPIDNWYTKVSGNDNYPDIILGRIPARNEADLITVINKVQAYEQSLMGSWLRRAVLVADNFDSSHGTLFIEDMNMVANLLPTSIQPTHVNNLNGANIPGVVGNGALLLAYSGHGAGASSWSADGGAGQFFQTGHIANMTNGNNLPFVTVANCRNGYFVEYNTTRAMAEEFLLRSNKGGIATWAPSSYGFPSVDTILLEKLYNALLIDNDTIFASAATTARVQAYVQQGFSPVLYEAFTFFGDPAASTILPASLKLSGQDSPDPVTMGNKLTYTLHYTVETNSQSPGLILVNTLPPGVSYQSASQPPSSINGQTLTWNLGNVTSGTNSIAITALVNSSGLAHNQSLSNQAHLYDVTGGDQYLTLTTTVLDAPPVASFISSAPDFVGQVTALQSTSAGTNLSYTWNFGDGSPPQLGASAIITHTYASTGLYTVALTVSNSLGSSSATGIVEIVSTTGPPLASFISSSPDEVGETTFFINTSQDGGDIPANITYAWSFGDGSPPYSPPSTGGTGGVIDHTYPSTGSYTVWLTITNSIASDTYSATVVIEDPASSGSTSNVFLPLIIKGDGSAQLP
jgi:PKD repeat protein